MGKSLTPVSFFSDQFSIEPHTATQANHIGRKVKLSTFGKGKDKGVSLSKIDETGEYFAQVVNIRTGARGDFIEGPMV